MEIFGTEGIADLLATFPQYAVIIGVLLLFPLAFQLRSAILTLIRLYNSRYSQLTERITSLLLEESDSKAKIAEQNQTIQRLQEQLNECMHSNNVLQQENDELKMTVKLLGDENVNMKDKIKKLTKCTSEMEQRNADLNSMMALMEKDLLDKTMKIFTLERALVAERSDIIRLRQRLVETTDLLVLYKKSRLGAFPQFADRHRSRSQKYNNSAIFKEILHELASEEINSADSGTGLSDSLSQRPPGYD